MTAWAYYNEFDPHAAEWLRNLIKNGLIAPGEVDGRDIREVQPDDLRGFTQCHFFAGIGVWSYSLRRAGWPDSRPVWTGSCPCQGFSSSGLQRGFDDERHLWPDWYRLIRAERPPVIFGEQVASALIVGRANYKAGEHGPYGLYGSDSETENPTAWLDLVQTDLERSVYAVGVQVTAAAGSGAPHIRQRLFFVGERLEHAASDGRDERWTEPSRGSLVSRRGFDGMGNGERSGLEGGDGDRPDRPHLERGTGRPGPTNGFWGDVDWLFCRDGKWRPVRPGTLPLVDGSTFRVDSGSPYEGKSRQELLKGAGNAIVSEVAIDFIETYLEASGRYIDADDEIVVCT